MPFRDASLDHRSRKYGVFAGTYGWHSGCERYIAWSLDDGQLGTEMETEVEKRTQFGLASVETEPLHEKVYREIARALISGQFEPGQKLTSRKLAKELGTSDMPVRSALLRLQALHALNALPNGSLEVPVMTVEAFSQLTDARKLLEGGATARASALLNGNNLRTVRRLSNELTEAARKGDIGQYLAANYDFKFSIYRHCGNEALIFLIETLWMQVGPFLRRFAEGFDGDLSGILAIDYHEDALAALEAGNADAASAAIIKDIEAGAVYLLANARFGD
ncbi:GntR family transcriptional regulator [Ensifer sp.]|uniref:GntR family transcriptional regulator n=1 Tax=Ensifer sp. TaxID=1872086 RepID=UPI00289EB1C6|nr:GntR family transcriptional regulator [Ensifer sp.]